jgi:hypothetical protein
MTDDIIAGMLERVLQYRDLIDPSKILPRVRWSNPAPRTGLAR